MNTLIIEGKKPKINPWLIVKYALKFWPVSLTALGVLAMVLHATWAVYEWIDLGGWDDLKDAVDNKVKNYGRLEDE